jgi:hypothetical protein
MNETPAQTPVPGAESPVDERTDLPEGEGTGEAHEGSDTRVAALSREAKRYRTQLREAEARVAQLQRAEVERLASDGLSHPADLFSLSGNELADYLTESGDVDAEKVAADVAAILAERPGLRKQTPGYDPTQGYGGKPPAKAKPTWGALFQPE